MIQTLFSKEDYEPLLVKGHLQEVWPPKLSVPSRTEEFIQSVENSRVALEA